MPPPTFSGDTTIRSAPNHSMREHGADDVDDRVERADLVQVHLLHRHLVDRGFGLGEPLEQLRAPGPGPAAESADRSISAKNLRQAAVRVCVLL